MIAEKHAGRVAKVWLSASGLPPHFMAFAWPRIPESYAFGTAPLVAAFELQHGDPETTEAGVVATLSRRHPEAQFGPSRWHDWVSDPFSQGAWHAARPGQVRGYYDLAATGGPCFFAGGDLSRRWVGWMDGALTSGADAARRVDQFVRLGADTTPEG